MGCREIYFITRFTVFVKRVSVYNLDVFDIATGSFWRNLTWIDDVLQLYDDT